jgi:hypothetical protein
MPTRSRAVGSSRSPTFAVADSLLASAEAADSVWVEPVVLAGDRVSPLPPR